MKLSYRTNCILFKVRKIVRVIIGLAAFLAFILGSAENNNIITTGVLCLGSVLTMIYLFATQLQGIYTSDGVKIRRVKK